MRGGTGTGGTRQGGCGDDVCQHLYVYPSLVWLLEVAGAGKDHVGLQRRKKVDAPVLVEVATRPRRAPSESEDNNFSWPQKSR